MAERDDSGVSAWPLLPTLAAFVAGFALMTWPWLTGRVTIPWDAKAHFLPQVQFLAQSLWAGEAPWWNPYVFSGQPQVADPQSMLFSPPFVILALLNPSPGTWAGDVTILASMCLGGIGLMLWFRDRRWHAAGALLAALVFAFGAAMAWRLQHWGQVLSLSYLPWVLLWLDRAVERRSLGAGLAAGLVAAFLVLGRDQVALLCVYLLAARVLWLWAIAARPGRAVVGSLGPLAVGAVAGGLVVALPIAMTVLLAAESNRPAIDYAGAGAGSLHPALLTTFVIPHVFGAAGDMKDFWGPPSMVWVGTGLFTAQNVGQLYIGIVPMLLVAGAAATGRVWDRDVRFFTLALVFVLIYALGWYTPVFRVLHAWLPGVDLYRRPADGVFLIGALAAILAGYAVHVWFTTPWQRPGWRALSLVSVMVLAAFLAALVFGVGLERVPRLAVPCALALGWLLVGAGTLAWAAPRVALSPGPVALVLGLVTAADLGLNNGPTTSSALPPSAYEVLEPGTANAIIGQLKSRVVANEFRRDRIELLGLGFHWPNASMTHRLENTLGYNPVRLAHYSRATGAEDHVGLPEQRKLSPLFPSYRSLLADMLGLRFIAAGAPIETVDRKLAPGALTLLGEVGGAWIYENPRALPRVLFPTSARSADFDGLLATGRWPDFDPTREVLLASAPASDVQRRSGTARILTYGHTRIEIDAESPDGGYVVLNDVWHPWWYATVDASPVTIEQANVLFRAVAVPPGRHRVVMEFRPLAGVLAGLGRRFAARGAVGAGQANAGSQRAP